MRISKYLKSEFVKASHRAFGDVGIVLFGSRIDDGIKGGDFDLAIMSNISKSEFRKAKTQFFKYLLLKDIDLPIDLVHFESAGELLKSEIKKGIRLI